MVTEKGVSLLLYKDARVDQKILDETFSVFGWKRSHQMIDGNLYCTVEVWDEEQKAMLRRRKDRHRTALREPVSTGALDENFIRHRLSGFRQRELPFSRSMENM